LNILDEISIAPETIPLLHRPASAVATPPSKPRLNDQRSVFFRENPIPNRSAVERELSAASYRLVEIRLPTDLDIFAPRLKSRG